MVERSVIETCLETCGRFIDVLKALAPSGDSLESVGRGLGCVFGSVLDQIVAISKTVVFKQGYIFLQGLGGRGRSCLTVS